MGVNTLLEHIKRSTVTIAEEHWVTGWIAPERHFHGALVKREEASAKAGEVQVIPLAEMDRPPDDCDLTRIVSPYHPRHKSPDVRIPFDTIDRSISLSPQQQLRVGIIVDVEGEVCSRHSLRIYPFTIDEELFKRYQQALANLYELRIDGRGVTVMNVAQRDHKNGKLLSDIVSNALKSPYGTASLSLYLLTIAPVMDFDRESLRPDASFVFTARRKYEIRTRRERTTYIFDAHYRAGEIVADQSLVVSGYER